MKFGTSIAARMAMMLARPWQTQGTVLAMTN
jgi:hypothetical protein